MRYIIVVAIGVTALLASQFAQASSPTKVVWRTGNLIVNPGGESGPATPDTATEVLPVPGWQVTGGFFTAAYNGFRWAPDPKDRTRAAGAKFFVGCFAPPGQTVNVGKATQDVSLAKWAQDIDKKMIRVSFSAELGGYNGTENRAVAWIEFLNSNNARTGDRVRLVGPTYLQRQGVTRVEPRATVAPVPAGARTARVILAGSRTGSGPAASSTRSASASVTPRRPKLATIVTPPHVSVGLAGRPRSAAGAAAADACS